MLFSPLLVVVVVVGSKGWGCTSGKGAPSSVVVVVVVVGSKGRGCTSGMGTPSPVGKESCQAEKRKKHNYFSPDYGSSGDHKEEWLFSSARRGTAKVRRQRERGE